MSDRFLSTGAVARELQVKPWQVGRIFELGLVPEPGSFCGRRAIRDLAVGTSEQQVTFPVTWYRPIFSRGWALADRHGVNDSSVGVCLLRVVARAAHASRAPQMLQQFLLQGPTGLNEQAAVDGLV